MENPAPPTGITRRRALTVTGGVLAGAAAAALVSGRQAGRAAAEATAT
ncbi:hypothetical protein [Streptomyces sp. NPDC002088]